MTVLLATSGNARALWYLTRGTGAVALLLLSAGVVLGAMGPTRRQTRRLPRYLVAGLHRNVTLLALAFVAVHVVTTVADRFAPIGYQDGVLPFLSAYRPLWLGLGTVAFDLMLALIATSLLRARVGLRAWRLVHWLAYVSWPVALLHTLGAGSDARAGWLALLALACTGAVLLSVLWRVGTASAGSTAVRVGIAVAALAVPLAILAWARSGPLEPGWAARAGTPKSLLASSRLAAAHHVATSASTRPAAATAPAATVPNGSFQAGFRGRLREARAGRGLVTVTIDGTASGGFSGRVHVALRGVPLGGGGVQMLASSVGLLPRGAGAWSPGRVVALAGQRILADVRGPSGRTVRVLLALRIDPSSGSVSGLVSGGHSVGGDENGGPSD